MSASPFPQSTVVMLKSGGPAMVFSHYVEPKDCGPFGLLTPSGCYCVWMDTDGHTQEGWFNKDHLGVAPPRS